MLTLFREQVIDLLLIKNVMLSTELAGDINLALFPYHAIQFVITQLVQRIGDAVFQ